MVSPALQDLAARAEGAGQLTGAGVGRGEGEHPICGDHVRIELRLDGEGGEARVAELAWAAQGCPALMAVAAASHKALVGQPPARFPEALQRLLDQHGGLARHEQHAAKVVLRAAAAAADVAGTRRALSQPFKELLKRLRGSRLAEGERHRLAALLQLNRSLATAPDRVSLLTRLVDEAVQLFAAERGFLIRAKGDGLEAAAARSLDREPVRKPLEKVSRTVVRTAMAGEGVHSDDAQLDGDGDGDNLAAAASIADLRLRSVLCAPLHIGDEVLGVLYLDHRFRSGAFHAGDLPWLQAFADQAGIALHLHDLLAADRARADRLEHQLAEQTEALVAARTAPVGPQVSRADLEGDYAQLVGESRPWLRVLHTIDRVREQDLPVLLTGESGTGKEQVARALHRCGSRRAQPFVAVNVAAIPEALLESELFGHVRGAFTGADRDRAGLCRDADGGVLFLDEITEMAPELQARLLRFLEERTVRPLGGTESVPVDVRVIAATNRDPLQAVQDGVMRADLYYRLAVVVVPLPPLRERREDIPLLVAAFAAEAAAERGGAPRQLAKDLLPAMERRNWPGNVRQLRNEVLRLDAMAEGDTVRADMLAPEAPLPDARGLNLASLESWAVARAMEVAKGNKSEAARLLGISRRALYNKLGG